MQSGQIFLKEITLEDKEVLEKFFIRNNRPEIITKFNPFPLDSDTVKKICQDFHKDKYLLAIEGSDVVGFSMLRGWDEGFDVPSFGMFVDYERQGKGLGRIILDLTLEYAKKLGCSKVRLSVYESNKNAYDLYKHFGFEEISRSLLKVGNREEVKIIMVKELQ